MRAILLATALGLPAATLLDEGPAPNPAPTTVTEPRSKVAFPLEVTVPTAARDSSESEREEPEDVRHVLAGTGLRTKTIFDVKVYAFGLYVDRDLAREHLAEWGGREAAELEKDAKLYRELLAGDVGLTLRMVMTRTVDGGDIRENFDETVGSRVRAADAGEAATEALDRFQGFFRVKELKKGTELVFSWLPGGVLRASIDGVSKPEVESEALCRAIFDCYLGEKPVSKKGKRTVIARLPEILKVETAEPQR